MKSLIDYISESSKRRLPLTLFFGDDTDKIEKYVDSSNGHFLKFYNSEKCQSIAAWLGKKNKPFNQAKYYGAYDIDDFLSHFESWMKNEFKSQFVFRMKDDETFELMSDTTMDSYFIRFSFAPIEDIKSKEGISKEHRFAKIADYFEDL